MHESLRDVRAAALDTRPRDGVGMHVEIGSEDTRRGTAPRRRQRAGNVYHQQHRLTRDDARLQPASVVLGERRRRSNDEHVKAFDECRHRGHPLTTRHRRLREHETLNRHTCFDCCTHTQVRYADHRQPRSGPSGCRRDGECHAQRSVAGAGHRATTHHPTVGKQRQQRRSNRQWGARSWHAETRT